MKISTPFIKFSFGLWLGAILLSGCSGVSVNTDTDSSQATATQTQTASNTTEKELKVGTGVYIDSIVEGINYECGQIKGVTDSDGIFVYEISKSCTFKLGSLTLRRVDSSKLTTDEVAIQETNEKVSQLLLSLNISSEPEKLIKIDKLLSKEFVGSYYEKDINDVNISELISHAQNRLKEKGITTKPIKVVTIDEAREHLKDSYRKFSKDDNYQLADNNNEIFEETTKDVELYESKEENKSQNQNKTKELHAQQMMGQGENSFDDLDDSKSNLQNGSSNSSSQDEKPSNSGNSQNKQDQSSVLSHSKNTDQNKDENSNKNSQTQSQSIAQSDYSYIPKGTDLTDRMAVKFLNMATFGATPELIKDLKKEGVKKWIDKQLSKEYNPQQESVLRRMIKMAEQIDYNRFTNGGRCSLEDWFKEDSGCYFNRGGGFADLMRVHGSTIFNAHASYENQLRQRVAYALSQIIVVSQSNDSFFTYHSEALSYYYDILQKDAFAGYDQLLYDISLTPAMGVYLSFVNNQKAHEDTKTHTTIYPDENYGREIMQLFSIGLFELNMDGTMKRVNGKRVSTYEQEDVMNISRVFTGLKYAHSSFNAPMNRGVLTKPMVCDMDQHDTEPKEILGETISGGGDCYQDIKSTISLLVNHQNIAPFIAKKLILRLTKSNPTTAYIQRVAEVFRDSQGSLKETVKAVLLDSELWDDIKSDRGIKIKEPYVAFIELLRAVDAKPLRQASWGKVKISNPGFFTNGLYDRFGQWPTQSPSVFNFYSDDFVPDDNQFKIRGFVAPEAEIFTAGYNVKMINSINDILYYNSVQIRRVSPEEHPERFASNYVRVYFEYKDIIDIFKKNGFGEDLDKGADNSQIKEQVTSKVIDYISEKFLGKKLSDQKRELLINTYKDARWQKKGNRTTSYMEGKLIESWIKNIIIDIFFSADFMIQ